MSLSDVVSVQILTTGVALTAAGFGTPLIVGEFATGVFSERIKEYGGLDEILVDFAATTPEYLAAQAIFSQKPAPSAVKIARRLPGTGNVQTLTVAFAVDATPYSVTLFGQVFTHTAITGSTTTTIRDALLALIVADTTGIPVTSTSSGATDIVFTMDFTPVELEITGVTPTNLTLVDTTPFVVSSETLTVVLTAVTDEDDDWYGMMMASRLGADISDAAAYLETKAKIAKFRDNSSNALDSGDATDPGSVLQAAGYTRSSVEYSSRPWNFPDAAHLGNRLGFSPDSTTTTWIYNDLIGVVPDVLTTTEKSALQGKNISYFLLVSGVRLTFEGKQASGEFTDVVLGGDWLAVRLQEDVLVAQASAVKVGGKIPYTDGGIQVLDGVLRGRLEYAAGTGLLTGGDDTVIQLPAISSASSGDKANRTAPPIKFSAILQGAIHKSQFEGTLSVA